MEVDRFLVTASNKVSVQLESGISNDLDGNQALSYGGKCFALVLHRLEISCLCTVNDGKSKDR